MVSAITQVSVKVAKKTRAAEEEPCTSTVPGETETEEPIEPSEDSSNEILLDGLAFWLATKSIAFKLPELESTLKQILHNAGFSTEECSVSHFHSCDN